MMPHFVYVRSCSLFICTQMDCASQSFTHKTGVFRYGYTHSNPLRPPIHPLSRGLTCHYATTSHVFPYTRAVWQVFVPQSLLCVGVCSGMSSGVRVLGSTCRI